ncbi:NAD(+)/NADH kinase [Patescibacteria group bacterium]|nr:NAD(+)/NADH kinase [Patescibacteria group bacterium]
MNQKFQKFTPSGYNQAMRTIGIIAKEHDLPKYHANVKAVLKFLKGKTILIDKNVAKLLRKKPTARKRIISKSDFIIIFGGDGTILKTVQLLSKKSPLILGINIGGLGVLTQAKPNKALLAVKKILAKKYKLDRRTYLDVKLNGKRLGVALNEAAINQGPYTRLIDFNVKVGTKVKKFCSDGLIIATPSGSTAYSHSAGGPILKPNTKSLIITPICPRAQQFKPVKVKDGARITIKFKRYHNIASDIGISLDGQKNARLTYKDEIQIQKAKAPIQFAVPGNSF